MGFTAHRARWGFALALLATLGAAAPARGAAYTILDLGTLGGTQSQTQGYNVLNASGQVRGGWPSGSEDRPAFRAAANGPIVQGAGGSDLGTLGGDYSTIAYGINASGQAVGISYTTGNATFHAFRTSANGPIVQGAGGSDLGTLGGSGSAAYGINASGQAVGYSYNAGDAANHTFAFGAAAHTAIVQGATGP